MFWISKFMENRREAKAAQKHKVEMARLAVERVEEENQRIAECQKILMNPLIFYHLAAKGIGNFRSCLPHKSAEYSFPSANFKAYWSIGEDFSYRASLFFTHPELKVLKSYSVKYDLLELVDVLYPEIQELLTHLAGDLDNSTEILQKLRENLK